MICLGRSWMNKQSLWEDMNIECCFYHVQRKWRSNNWRGAIRSQLIIKNSFKFQLRHTLFFHTTHWSQSKSVIEMNWISIQHSELIFPSREFLAKGRLKKLLKIDTRNESSIKTSNSMLDIIINIIGRKEREKMWRRIQQKLANQKVNATDVGFRREKKCVAHRDSRPDGVEKSLVKVEKYLSLECRRWCDLCHHLELQMKKVTCSHLVGKTFCLRAWNVREKFASRSKRKMMRRQVREWGKLISCLVSPHLFAFNF